MEWDNTEQNYLVHLVAIIIIMLRMEALAFFLLLLLHIVIHLWLEKVFWEQISVHMVVEYPLP